MKLLVIVALLVLYCSVHTLAVQHLHDILNERLSPPISYDGISEEDGKEDYDIQHIRSNEVDDDDDYASNEDESDEHRATSQEAESNSQEAAPRTRPAHKKHGQRGDRTTNESERSRSEKKLARKARRQQRLQGKLDNGRLIFGLCRKVKKTERRLNVTISSEMEPIQACCNQVAVARVLCFEEYIAGLCPVAGTSDNDDDDDDNEDDDNDNCCKRNADGQMRCILKKVKGSQFLSLKQEYRRGGKGQAQGRRERARDRTHSN